MLSQQKQFVLTAFALVATCFRLTEFNELFFLLNKQHFFQGKNSHFQLRVLTNFAPALRAPIEHFKHITGIDLKQ